MLCEASFLFVCNWNESVQINKSIDSIRHFKGFSHAHAHTHTPTHHDHRHDSMHEHVRNTNPVYLNIAVSKHFSASSTKLRTQNFVRVKWISHWNHINNFYLLWFDDWTLYVRYLRQWHTTPVRTCGLNCLRQPLWWPICGARLANAFLTIFLV